MGNINLISFISDAFVFGSHAYTLFLLSPRKYHFRTAWRIWLSVFLISLLLIPLSTLQTFVTPALIVHPVSLGLCCAIFLLTSSGPLLQNLFLFATYTNYFVFSLAVSQAVATHFMDQNPIATLEFRLIFAVLFCVVIVFDLRPAFQKIAKNVRRGWFSLTMLASIFSVCLVGLMLTSGLFVHSSQHIITTLVALFVIMVSAYIVIFHLIMILSKESHEERLELEGKFLREQLTGYEQLERESSKNRHDFRHHNLIILEHAKNRNHDAIIQYLQEYEAAAESKQIPRLCANVTVNSIVTAFARRAQEQGIQMETNIRIPKTIFVSDTHVVAILANVLENALKGSLLATSKPWIDLFMVQRGSKLIIQCKNSCADDIHFSNGIPRAVGRTGVGVTSIIDTVSEYSGNAEFMAEDGAFTCRMVLNDPAISN